MKNDGQLAKEKIRQSTDVLASAGGRPRGSTKVRLTLSRLKEIARLIVMHDRSQREMFVDYVVKQRSKVGGINEMVAKLIARLESMHSPLAQELKQLAKARGTPETVADVTAHLESMRLPLAEELRQLAKAWDISERTAWSYCKSVRDAKTGFHLLSPEEQKGRDRNAKIFNQAHKEIEAMVSSATMEALLAGDKLYPSEALDIAERFVALVELGHQLQNAGPSRALDITRQVEQLARENAESAAVAFEHRKR